MHDNKLKRLDKIIKKSFRIIYKLKNKDSTKQYMKDLGWLPIRPRIELKIALLIHKAMLYKEPKYLLNLLEVKDKKGIETR